MFLTVQDWLGVFRNAWECLGVWECWECLDAERVNMFRCAWECLGSLRYVQEFQECSAGALKNLRFVQERLGVFGNVQEC